MEDQIFLLLNKVVKCSKSLPKMITIRERVKDYIGKIKEEENPIRVLVYKYIINSLLRDARSYLTMYLYILNQSNNKIWAYTLLYNCLKEFYITEEYDKILAQEYLNLISSSSAGSTDIETEYKQMLKNKRFISPAVLVAYHRGADIETWLTGKWKNDVKIFKNFSQNFMTFIFTDYPDEWRGERVQTVIEKNSSMRGMVVTYQSIFTSTSIDLTGKLNRETERLKELQSELANISGYDNKKVREEYYKLSESIKAIKEEVEKAKRDSMAESHYSVSAERLKVPILIEKWSSGTIGINTNNNNEGGGGGSIVAHDTGSKYQKIPLNARLGIYRATNFLVNPELPLNYEFFYLMEEQDERLLQLKREYKAQPVKIKKYSKTDIMDLGVFTPEGVDYTLPLISEALEKALVNKLLSSSGDEGIYLRFITRFVKAFMDQIKKLYGPDIETLNSEQYYKVMEHLNVKMHVNDLNDALYILANEVNNSSELKRRIELENK